MGALRKQHIHEILNYDRNINLRVLSLAKEAGSQLGAEGGKTGEVLNQDVIDASNS